MPIHLRQICLVARELQSAVDDLSAILGIRTCHIDPAVGKWGLENALLPVGSDFLEVVAPIRDGTSAARHLQRRGGDGGYMVICQLTSRAAQDQLRDRAAQKDVRVAYEQDRGDWTIMQLHPGDMKGAYLEADWDQQEDPTGRWMPAGGTDWQRHISTEQAQRITGVELQGPDPLTMARHWADICDVAVQTKNGDAIVPLANATIRFVTDTDGRGPGLGGIDIQAKNPDHIREIARGRGCLSDRGQIMICGTRIYLT
jgi:hypothetical protein